MRGIVIAGAAALLTLVISSSAVAQGKDTRATVGSVSGEVGLGLGAGLVGTITGAAVGTAVGRIVRGKWVQKHDDDIDPFAGIAALAGNVGGSTLGVYLAGRRAQVTESVWWTLGGAAIGQAIAIGSVYYLERKRSGNDNAWIRSYLMLLAGPTVGATIAFNVSRHRTTIPIAMNLRF